MLGLELQCSFNICTIGPNIYFKSGVISTNLAFNWECEVNSIFSEQSNFVQIKHYRISSNKRKFGHQNCL